ncbi:SprT-like domain-containing protein [Rubritalea marina]|uniref:SprT-like domain-containing protein n=1 Tax=Rubritalea marina TaxID=361055 RepID=UPI000A033A24
MNDVEPLSERVDAVRLQQLVADCIAILDGADHGREVAARVSVAWNSRMRSAAGRAFWPECRVDLNPRLLDISLTEVRRTLLHELAHLLAYWRAGGRRIAPHGIEWRTACADLGIPGESATHRLSLPRARQVRKWRYVCPNCDLDVDRVRRVKRKIACASCCKRHSGGRFDQRFVMKEFKIG